MRILSKSVWQMYRFLQQTYGKKEASKLMKEEIQSARSRYTMETFRGVEWTIVSTDDSPSVLYKTFIPRKLTREEYETFMEDCRYEYIPRDYDCTGQWFTSWDKKYSVPNGTWIYQRVCMDC